MYKHYPLPTIIGSGLTGLLISLELSKARISHILLGGPPPTGGPRLGESLNLEATIYFLAQYPELADCYYEKGFAATHGGETIGHFDFSFLKTPQSVLGLGLWGKRAPDGLIHFDRVKLDAALYEKATGSPFCMSLDARVTEARCAPGSDHIQQLVLADGSTLPVSHVFDATGHIRLLARQLQIPRRTLGDPQRVAYVHYYRRDPVSSQPDMAWQHGTNIVRLYEERDGFNGLAWCIPLGNTISVGITTPQTNTEPTDEMLLQRAREVFARYQIDYGAVVHDQSSIGRARMEFYTHSRAFGTNWLLAAAAHTQVWWPTSAGIDTSVAAATVAVPFLRGPQRVGVRYQHYMAPLVQSNALWDWGASHRYGALTPDAASRFANRLYWSIMNRSLKAFLLEESDPLSQAMRSLTVKAHDLEFWSRLPSPVSIRRHT